MAAAETPKPSDCSFSSFALSSAHARNAPALPPPPLIVAKNGRGCEPAAKVLIGVRSGQRCVCAERGALVNTQHGPEAA
jgi:hypothetical protein